MNLKLSLSIALLGISSSAFAVKECNEKIVNYFVGTSQEGEAQGHLWVNFEGGGSAAVSTQSGAFEGMLSTVIYSIASDKTVKLRYLSDSVDCKAHHSDWVGIWLLK